MVCRTGIVGPRAGILEVPDVVAEAAETEQVLDIVPRDAAEGVLAEKSGDDDAHGQRVSGKLERVTRKGR